MTQAACSMAWGEHQPWKRCAAASAGSAAERKSGYLAIAASISARSSAGTGVVAGSGISAGSLVRSTARSQPGTREPWSYRMTLYAIRGSAVDSAEDRVEHRQRGDQVGQVGVAHHRRGGLQVDERGVAHVHARGLGGAVGAHEAAVLAARALDRVVDLA